MGRNVRGKEARMSGLRVIPRGRWRRDAQKVCAPCGGTFEPPADISEGAWKKRQYCSPKCASDARWERIRAAKKGGAL